MTRDRAIEILRDDASGASLWELAEAVEMGIKALEEERPHGEWIDDDINSNEKYHFFKCSVCGGDGVPRCNFCPNCGAKMVEEEGEQNDRERMGEDGL